MLSTLPMFQSWHKRDMRVRGDSSHRLGRSLGQDCEESSGVLCQAQSVRVGVNGVFLLSRTIPWFTMLRKKCGEEVSVRDEVDGELLAVPLSVFSSE